MTIALNDTIVPGRDKEAAARFLAQLFLGSTLQRELSGSRSVSIETPDTCSYLVQEAAGYADKRGDCAHPSGGIAHHGDLRRTVGVVLSLVAGCMFGPGSRPFFK